MVKFHRALCGAVCVLALLGSLAGCGGSSSNSALVPPPGGGPPLPEVIQGVATPSSVAVVTATNAT
jgi:hypothetical protein